MTTINIATDIPSQIKTLEQLAMWADLSLKAINPSAEGIEGVGYTEKTCQANIFWIAVDVKHRFLGRVSLVVSDDWLAGGTKTWMYAQELSNTALPASFKSN